MLGPRPAGPTGGGEDVQEHEVGPQEHPDGDSDSKETEGGNKEGGGGALVGGGVRGRLQLPPTPLPRF